MRRVETRVVVSILGAAVLGLAAFGFLSKFFEFVRALSGGEAEGFAIVPVVNYLIVGTGFLLLLIWSFLRGDMKDIEKPKYDMLKREEELEVLEGERNYQMWIREELSPPEAKGSKGPGAHLICAACALFYGAHYGIKRVLRRFGIELVDDQRERG